MLHAQKRPAEKWGAGNWQIGVDIIHGRFRASYGFEPFTMNKSIAELQAANIFVSNGSFVRQGQLIGNLIYGGLGGAHMDFDVIGNGGSDRLTESLCPAVYFTSQAYTSVLNLIHKFNSSWAICYT